ncbi:MAG: protein-L-isoaspartate O-methyltransferase [Candidatus Chloroheliales bacterium]|nr:MAG: protein-L-isoaspartate O-methyltransferase [Chloroflexota bacterium]
MVSSQLAGRGIRNPRVLAAMERVPRHRFLPRELWPAAYEDRALPLPQGQTISQPYMVAIMSELLELQGVEQVLEVGTGSGYQTAVLAELAAEVYSIERVAELSARGLQNISNLGYNMASKLHLAVGDGSKGWPNAAPFDAILVTAGAPVVPEALAAQLKDGGRLVIPVGSNQQQMLLALRREGGALIEKSLIPCMFVPLIGEQGWQDDTGGSGSDEQNV